VSQDRLFEPEIDALRPWQRSDLPDPSVNRPAPVHRNAHDTERTASGLVFPRTGTLRLSALIALDRAGEDGLTHGELAEQTGHRHYSIAPRVTELVRDGWVVDSGRRRPTDTGSPAIVWVLSARGKADLL
jgi:hypothetical protein